MTLFYPSIFPLCLDLQTDWSEIEVEPDRFAGETTLDTP
jgi:hypothetical protein